MRREQVHAVIAPSLHAGKGIDRHQFDMRDAEIAQRIELCLRRVEGAFRRERPDMQFVNDSARQRRRFPSGVGPLKRRVVEDA
jgi:hypothetical protein